MIDQIPQIYKALEIKEYNNYVIDTENNGIVTTYNYPRLARPLAISKWSNIFKRFQLAYEVFKGKYDVLDWEN